MTRSPQTRLFHILLLIVVLLLILACSGLRATLPTASTEASWACPSPTPRTYGEAGPVKDQYDCNFTTACTCDDLGSCVCTEMHETCFAYYAIWEQECIAGTFDGTCNPDHAPFPAPTPYTRQGLTFAFGQLVSLPPYHLSVDVRDGSAMGDEQQLHFIDVTWINGSTTVVTMTHPFVAITAVDAGGIITTGSWFINQEAMTQAGLGHLDDPLPLPAGESQHTYAVLTPPGTALEAMMLLRNGDDTAPTPLELRWRSDIENTCPERGIVQ